MGSALFAIDAKKQSGKDATGQPMPRHSDAITDGIHHISRKQMLITYELLLDGHRLGAVTGPERNSTLKIARRHAEHFITRYPKRGPVEISGPGTSWLFEWKKGKITRTIRKRRGPYRKKSD